MRFEEYIRVAADLVQDPKHFNLSERNPAPEQSAFDRVNSNFSNEHYIETHVLGFTGRGDV